MKMNFARILLAVMMLGHILTYAQKNTENIDGVYKVSDAAFVINKNKTFLVMAYGTLIKGTWSIKKDLIELKPQNPDAKFYVYARKNPNIKTGMRIGFSGDKIGNSGILVGEFPNKMQPLFNEDANCFDFPYVHVFKEKPATLSLLEEQNYENEMGVEIPKLIYNFPTGDYNDFIVQHMQDGLYHNDFIFKMTKDGSSLVDDSGKPLRKSTVKEAFPHEEELKFMEGAFNRAFDADYKLVNNAYNTHDDMDQEIDLEYYKYDAQKNVYVNPAVPAKQLNYKSEDYHYNEVLMKFDKIKGTSQPQVAVKPLSNSIFTAKCNR